MHLRLAHLADVCTALKFRDLLFVAAPTVSTTHALLDFARYSAIGAEVAAAPADACGVATLEVVAFASAFRGDTGFLAALLGDAFWMAELCRTLCFEELFFAPGALLLGTVDFEGAFLIEAGPFAGREAFAEALAGDATRAVLLAAEVFDSDRLSAACCFAHRARCAAAILAFPSGLIVRRLGELNSLGLKLVALFLDPFGRPRFGASLGCPASTQEPVALSPPSRLRA